jgi:hypothetical protein
MSRLACLTTLLILLLVSCSATSDPRNTSCMQQSRGGERWGYYPGFGCGPVPRAQTLFP